MQIGFQTAPGTDVHYVIGLCQPVGSLEDENPIAAEIEWRVKDGNHGKVHLRPGGGHIAEVANASQHADDGGHS
jgi:hypothetical protein